MTQTDAPTVDNGVNIEALRGARQALTDAPEAAQFQWRASLRVGQGHAQPLHDHRLLRSRPAARAPAGVLDRGRPPAGVRVRGQRRDPAGDRPGRAGLVPDRGRRDGRDEPGRAAPLGDGDRGSRHGPAGHPRHRRRRAQRLQRRSTSPTTSTPTRPAPTSRRSWPSRRSARPSSTSSTNPTTVQRRAWPERRRSLDDGGRAMHVPVVIVGAGPGGLAMSHHLTGAGVDHVVLERGEVGNSWRRERWDSLRLLTPNWMTALPGYRYQGDDPNGFMTATDAVAFLDGYRRHFDPPVRTGVTVESVRRTADGFDVRTDHGRLALRRRGGGHRGVERAPRPRARRRDAAPHRPAHRAGLPATGAVRRTTAACSWSARRRRACRSPTSSAAPAARSPSPSASTFGCPVPTEGVTSTGGWTGSGSSTSATTKWTTSSAPAGTPRCSSSGTTTDRDLDLNALARRRRADRGSPHGDPRHHRAVLGIAREPGRRTPT